MKTLQRIIPAAVTAMVGCLLAGCGSTQPKSASETLPLPRHYQIRVTNDYAPALTFYTPQFQKAGEEN